MTNLHNLATVVALSGEGKCHLVPLVLRTFCGEHLHDMLRPQGYIEEQSTDNAHPHKTVTLSVEGLFIYFAETKKCILIILCDDATKISCC